ncbi:MAG: amidase [Pseudomonadales bacterium]
MSTNDLCFKSATEQLRLIATRQISCNELLEAHLRHIEAINPLVNAIVTLVPERALKVASDLDQRLGRGEAVGPLAGLPVAHKDLFPTKGIRTTHGSRRYAQHVPDENALVVERLQQAGAVTIGKTNTPEWGAGSQTFNDVFGATLNPWDTSKTCGGSSGGAATALAARMLPIADGSDMGGSLRNPASFCNVVGFRTSPGRVPAYPAAMGWFPLGVTGPMARNVSDCALLLSAMAGPDSRSPIAIDTAGSLFREPLQRDFNNVRIAFSPDFDGQIPVATSVGTVIETASIVFDDLGLIVERGCPDFDGADQAFKTLRAWSFAATHGDNVKAHPDLYKDTIIWNVEQGLKLTGADISAAEEIRTALYHRVRKYMQTCEFLVLPVVQVPPFDIDIEWIREIEGTQMETYIDWMKSCYFISTLGLPAISVPCGFTDDGLPVGLQIVGRHHADFSVLQLAHAFEQATMHLDRLPAILAT